MLQSISNQTKSGGKIHTFEQFLSNLGFFSKIYKYSKWLKQQSIFLCLSIKLQVRGRRTVSVLSSTTPDGRSTGSRGWKSSICCWPGKTRTARKSLTRTPSASPCLTLTRPIRRRSSSMDSGESKVQKEKYFLSWQTERRTVCAVWLNVIVWMGFILWLKSRRKISIKVFILFDLSQGLKGSKYEDGYYLLKSPQPHGAVKWLISSFL